MLPDARAQIERLHASYVRLSGLVITLDLAGCRESVWFEWMRHGWGEPELEIVVRYINRCIRNGERGFNSGSLRFNALIGQPDTFEERLAEAQSASRAAGRRIDPNWASVMRATGRDPEAETRNPKSETRSAGEVAARVVSDPVAGAAALEELRKLRASL